MSRAVHDPYLFDLDNDENDEIFGGSCATSPAKSKSSSTGDPEERILSPDEFAALGVPNGQNLLTADLPSPGSSKSGYSESSEASTSSSKSRYLYPKLDTVDELRPEEVRWFYKELGEKKWTAFIGYDSLRIECKYRELQHRVVKSDQSEDASDEERINVRGSLYEVDVVRKECYPVYWASTKEAVEIVMRGTWFVDSTWQPIEECNADEIENEHLGKFQNEKIPEEATELTKGHLPVIHHIKFKEFHVDWNSVDKVYLYSETTSSKFYRAVGTKLGLAKSGTRLHRGYCYEARMDDKPPDITHLVFVVHGIGQKMESGSIIKCCAELRTRCNRAKEKFFTSLDVDNKRVELLPCAWRTALKLDGDTVETITPNKIKGLRQLLNSSAMDILYYTSPLYRSEITQCLQTELNRLFTMFCARHPYFEANGGKVSIAAHSLGAVITYDIISGWNPMQLYDQYVSHIIKTSAIVGNQIYFSLSSEELEQKCQQVEQASSLISELAETRKKVNDLETQLLKMAEKQHLKTPTLKFELENFFCLGSPLAVFLALRGVRPKGNSTLDHILPQSLCCRLFNMYHPSDPVAYRLEPLVIKHYSTLLPLRIHRYESTKKGSYEDMPLLAQPVKKAKSKKNQKDKDKSTENGSPTEENGKDKEEKSSPVSWVNMFKRNRKYNKIEDSLSAEMKVLDSLEKVEEDEGDEEDWVNLEVKFEGQDAEEHPELEYRLDYQLKEGKMENAYMSALTSHTAYWYNMDVALFIMSQTFPGYAPS